VAVSVINVINHQGLLVLANSGWGWSGGVANVFAAMVAAVPAYLLSRYWVWDVRGRHSFRAEIVPFWTISLIGLLLSTLFAETADRAFGAGVFVSLASLVAYFIVWVAKFLVLDGLFTRTIERSERSHPEPVS
jgi:putative flippase GtrA